MMDGGVSKRGGHPATLAHPFITDPDPLLVKRVKGPLPATRDDLYGWIHSFEKESMTAPNDVGRVRTGSSEQRDKTLLAGRRFVRRSVPLTRFSHLLPESNEGRHDVPAPVRGVISTEQGVNEHREMKRHLMRYGHPRQ